MSINLTDATGRDTAAQIDEQRAVFRTSTGTPYVLVAYMGDTTNVDRLAMFKGNATTPTSFTEQNSAGAPFDTNANIGSVRFSAAIDSANVIHVVYLFHNDGQVRYRTFSTSTDTWVGSAVAVNTSPTGDMYVSIAVDSNDIPHVLSPLEEGMMTGIRGPSYRNRIGGTWSTAQFIGVSTNQRTFPDIAINGSNIPVVTYHDTTNARLRRAIANANNPASWTLSDVDTTISTAARPSIAIDSGGADVIAYVDSGGTISVRDAGGTIRTTGSTGTRPSVVCDGTNIVVFYEDANNDIAYRTWNGSAWSTAVVVQTGTFNTPIVNAKLYSSTVDYIFFDETATPDAIWDTESLATGDVTALPGVGSVTVAGQAPTSAASVSAAPGTGTVTATGLAPTVSASFTASPGTGAVTATGLAPTVAASSVASPTTGSVTVTGLAPTVETATNATAAPGTGAVTVTGLAATASASFTALPGAGAVTATGLAPTVSASVVASPDAGAVTVTGLAPTASAGVSAGAGAGSVTLLGAAPTVSATASATPSTGAVTVVGYAPTVDVAGNVTLTPGVGTVAVAGLAPTVSAGAVASTGTGAVTVTGLQPTVEVSASVTAAPGAGSVSVVGLAPTVTASVSALPSTGSVTVVGLAPTVAANSNAAPGTGSVTVTGFAPSVSVDGSVSVAPGLGSVTVVGHAPSVSVGAIRSRGGYPYESSGKSRDYFYQKQIAEVEEKLERFTAKVRKAKKARKVNRPQIIASALDLVDFAEVAPVREAVREYKRAEIDWPALERAALALIEEEKRQIAVARKRRRNDDAIALLMAA